MSRHDERLPGYPLVFFGLLAAGIVVGAVAYERRQALALTEEAGRKLAAIAQLKAEELARWRRDRVRDAAVAVASWSDAGELERPPRARADARQLSRLLAAFREGAGYSDVAVVLRDGGTLAAAGRWMGGVPEVKAPPAEPALDRLVVIQGRPVQHVLVPARTRRGEVVGTALFRVDAEEELLPMIRDAWPTPSPTGELLLLAAAPGGVAYLSPRRFLPGDALAVVPAAVDAASAAALAGGARPGGARALDYRGADVLVAWHPVAEGGWVLAAKVDRAELLGPQLERSALVLLAGLAIVAAAGAGVHLYARRERLRFLERAWSAERRARLLRDEQARLVEAVYDPVIALDPERRIRFWNGAAERLFGWTSGEAVGRLAPEVLQTEFRGVPTAEEQYRLLDAAGVIRTEFQQVRKDGTRVLVEGSGAVLKDPDGAPAGYLWVLRDLTERRRNEEVQRTLQARLLEADRMASMGLLAASVAHELATPIAYVLSNVRFAREELGHPQPDLKEILAAVEEAEEGSERARRIVADVKTFSRAHDGADTPAEVGPVVESAIRIATAELRHRARVVIDVPPLPQVRATGQRLGQVLLNLIVNAAQSIPPGEPERNEVRVAARRDGDAVLIEVSDTGPGVPDAVRAHLFEPFFTTKPAGVGTGLGLAISRRLLQESGGVLELAPSTGRGATFRIRLPVAAAAVPHAVRGKVLVVDDEPKVARALARSLEGDCEVHVETDPVRALERLQAGEDFDVVFCDLVMPRLDGLALYLQATRAHPDLAERFVFLSGVGPGSRRAEVVATGRPFVEKPFDLCTVRAMVQGRIRVETAA